MSKRIESRNKSVNGNKDIENSNNSKWLSNNKNSIIKIKLMGIDQPKLKQMMPCLLHVCCLFIRTFYF
jgi:endonuclease YncB( thermonuclease family)